MAIGTFAQLKSAAANWVHRSASSAVASGVTLDDLIEDCIALAEAKFNQRLRTRFQETALSATAIDASYQIAIPSNTLAIKSIWRTDSPLKPLKAQALEFIIARQTSGNLALHYAWEGSTWRFDGSGTVAGVLHRSIPALTDSNTTNWLLTANPDVYLHAVLAQAATFTRDAASLQLFAALAEAEIDELNRVARTDSFSGPLVVATA